MGDVLMTLATLIFGAFSMSQANRARNWPTALAWAVLGLVMLTIAFGIPELLGVDR